MTPTVRLPLLLNAQPLAAAQALPCGLNEGAHGFYVLWRTHVYQQRPAMVCDERLVDAAQRHAEWLASQRDAGAWQDGFPNLHIGEGNSTANERVRAAGYALPAWYPAQGNQVESIAVGSPTAMQALSRLIASPGHAPHLTGSLPFFAEQTRVGVGFAGTSVWVVVSAPPEA